MTMTQVGPEMAALVSAMRSGGEAPDTSACPYGKCGGSGTLRTEQDGYSIVSRCRCFRDRARRRIMTLGGFPSDYQGFSLWAETGRTSFQTVGENCQDKYRLVEICRRVAKSIWQSRRKGGTPDSLLLYGAPGTGKTHLACAITCDVLAKTEISVAFRDVDALNRELTDRVRESVAEGELLRPLFTVGLLVLDDANLDAAPSTETVVRRLGLILKARHEKRLPTIITTNMDLGGFREAQLPMIRSRMDERYRTAALNWGDFRTELARQHRRAEHE